MDTEKWELKSQRRHKALFRTPFFLAHFCPSATPLDTFRFWITWKLFWICQMDNWNDKLSLQGFISSMTDLHSQPRPEGSLTTEVWYLASGQKQNKVEEMWPIKGNFSICSDICLFQVVNHIVAYCSIWKWNEKWCSHSAPLALGKDQHRNLSGFVCHLVATWKCTPYRGFFCLRAKTSRSVDMMFPSATRWHFCPTTQHQFLEWKTC